MTKLVAYIGDLPAADRITFASKFDPTSGKVLDEWISTPHVRRVLVSSSGTYLLVGPSAIPVVVPPVLTPAQEAARLAAANLVASQAAVANAQAALESAIEASLTSGDRSAVIAADAALRSAQDLLGVRVLLSTSPPAPVRAAAVALEAAYVGGNAAAIEAAQTTLRDAERLVELRGF